MTRSEHLAWAKQRALEYVDQGNVSDAFTSMVSDLGKHDELQNHMGLEMMTMLFLSGGLNDPHAMRHYIEGFN